MKDKLERYLTLIIVILVLVTAAGVGVSPITRSLLAGLESSSESEEETRLYITVLQETESGDIPIQGANIQLIPQEGSPNDGMTGKNGVKGFTIRKQDSVEVIVTKEGFTGDKKEVFLHKKDEVNKQFYLEKLDEDLDSQTNGSREILNFETSPSNPSLSETNSKKPNSIAPPTGDELISLIREWFLSKNNIFTYPYKLEEEVYLFLSRRGGLAKCLTEVIIPQLKNERINYYEYSNQEFLHIENGNKFSGFYVSNEEAGIFVNVRETETQRSMDGNVIVSGSPYSRYFRYWFVYEASSNKWKIDDYCPVNADGECVTTTIQECPISGHPQVGTAK
jgi:hypothetical protein